MSLLTLVKNVGGTLETYFLDGQPTSCTVNLYSDAGSLKVNGASATVDTVSTTVSTAVSALGTSIVLVSASGVVNGRRYLVGATASTEPMEVVTVKSLSASTATLTAPLVSAHSAGTPFKGLRVSYTVSAAACDTLYWNGHADFIPTSGDPLTEDVDCVAHKIPDFLCDESDIREILPKLTKIVDAELDLPRSLRVARDQFLTDFGGKFRAHAALGAGVFRRPAALRWWLNRRYALGPDWSDDMDQMQKDYFALIEHLRAQVAFDTDGDERTDGRDDYGFTTIQLDRA